MTTLQRYLKELYTEMRKKDIHKYMNSRKNKLHERNRGPNN
jgi:hypothetical protein